MSIIHDSEFGDITIRRSPKASQVRVRVAPNGTLRVSLPPYAPLFLVKRLLKNSRDEIKALLDASLPKTQYEDGMRIGKSHYLSVTSGSTLAVKRLKQVIIVQLPPTLSLNDPTVITAVRKEVIAALRREAKGYLPRRLAWLAEEHGYTYQQVRFSHASGRWGSCSSRGTISLNIALMKLPFELIDYVIVHELAHTLHMNHSDHFWRAVEQADPNYRQHRKQLQSEMPSI